MTTVQEIIVIFTAVMSLACAIFVLYALNKMWKSLTVLGRTWFFCLFTEALIFTTYAVYVLFK